MPSAKILKQKQDLVKDLVSELKEAKSIVLVDFRGLTVEQDTELRSSLRKAGVKYKVIKNSTVRFAAKECGLDGLETYLNGPTAVAYSTADLVAPAKIMVEFTKKLEKLALKAGVVEGKVIDVEGVKALSELPPREVLVAKVLGLLNAPITGLVTVLNANLRGLAVALNAVAEKKSPNE